MDGRINWRHVEREDFEWLFEQLMLRKHRAANVRIPDDRGGDGGIDILVDYPGRRLVYQLKFYTDGLSSNEKTRKAQISRSFDKAMKLDPRPDEWILVVPCKYKDSIVDHVKKELVAKVVEGTRPTFMMIDQPELDFMLLAEPDLLARMSRDDHFTKLVQLHREEDSALAGGMTELLKRLRGLDGVIAELDDHWTLGYASNGRDHVFTPIAKHAHSHERSPLGVQFGIDLAGADEDLVAGLRDVIGFGASGEIVVPGALVRDLKWTGPELLDPTVGIVTTIRIGESESVATLIGKPCRISLFDEDERTVLHTEGPITRFAPGTTGYTVGAKFHHTLLVELHMPVKVGSEGNVTLKLDLNQPEPREVWRGIDLVYAIRAAATIQIHIDGNPLAVIKLAPADRDSEDPGLLALAEAARDLDIVQDRTGTIFAMPEEINSVERILLRVLRIILDGGIAPIPRYTIHGNTHPGSAVPSDGKLHASMVDFPDGIVELFGRPLRLGGPLRFYHPSTVIEALDGKPQNSGSRPFRMTSSDKTVFVAYVAGRVTTTTRVTPWSVHGIEDPLAPDLPRPNLEKGSATR